MQRSRAANMARAATMCTPHRLPAGMAARLPAELLPSLPVVNLVAATVWQVFGLRSAAAAGVSGRAKSWQYSNLPVGAVRSNATIRRGSGFEIHLERVPVQNPLMLAPDP